MTPPRHLSAVSKWDNQPTVGPRGTLIVVAGRGEHPGVYERFGARISADAYRVRAVDDPTVDPEGVEEQIRAVLAEADLSSPVVLVGSDAGALFAAGLLAQGRVEAEALVLAGLPAAEASGTPESWEDELTERTACPTHQGRLRADELLRHGALAEEPPAGWFKSADLTALDVPVLGLHGGADTISPLASVRPLYAAAPNARLVSIVGGKHDALNDATHRTAAATIVLFLESLKAGLPEIAHAEDLS